MAGHWILYRGLIVVHIKAFAKDPCPLFWVYHKYARNVDGCADISCDAVLSGQRFAPMLFFKRAQVPWPQEKLEGLWTCP